MGLMFGPKCIFKRPASPCFLSPAFSPFCNSVSISLTALKIAVIQPLPVINLTTSLSFLNSGSLPESVSASIKNKKTKKRRFTLKRQRHAETHSHSPVCAGCSGIQENEN